MNSDVTVRELMDREYVGVSESDGLIETVELLLTEDKETAVVLRGSEYVGVVTERDVLELLVSDQAPDEATVGDAMTDQVPTVSPEETVTEVADRLSTEPASRLIVTDGAEPFGVVTEADLLAGQNYPEQTAVADEPELVQSGAETTTQSASGEGFDDQGICEVCGSLARDLAAFNGQLLCADCRDM
ncbi:CBS domain-containing protein [Halobacteriaceae archaeon SHR40]|uniref:CBS domain-containing protein n=1 Tax=Halovenus amylolytica TaxID=2500550 RepID=UPI000FE436C7